MLGKGSVEADMAKDCERNTLAGGMTRTGQPARSPERYIETDHHDCYISFCRRGWTFSLTLTGRLLPSQSKLALIRTYWVTPFALTASFFDL